MKCEYHSEREAVDTCKDCGKGICDLCKTVVGIRVYCPTCIEKLLNIGGTTTEPIKKGRPLWIKIAGAVVVIVVIALVVTFTVGNNQELATNHELTAYQISVSGTQGVAFSGSFLITDSNGSTVSQTVDGIIPQTYTLTGSAVSVELQKKGDSGILDVQILRDSTVVGQGDTTEAFGIVNLAAVSVSQDYVKEAYNVAYETTKSTIELAVLNYCLWHNYGDLPVLEAVYSVSGCIDCPIIDMNLLMTSQGGILSKVPEGCYAGAGSNNDNCDGGAVGCSPSKHYVWILSDHATVHSKCIGSGCKSNDADGYQGVWP
ncbi:MAG: B-box zinc finger protein [Dehalococcoidia bacterium]|jgi:hypothetical protein